MRYALVRHTGWSVAGNAEFERAVEARSVTDGKARRIEEVGGVVLGGYDAASDAEMVANYPREGMGLVPRVLGSFVHARGFGEDVYVPAAEEVDRLRACERTGAGS